MSFPTEPWLLSSPVKVRWAGWVSDTFALQNAGWELSAYQDPCYRAVELAMRHPRLKMYGVSNRVDNVHMERLGRATVLPELIMQYMSSDLRVQTVSDSIAKFRPVDATPQIMETEIRHIDDWGIFKTLAREKQIIVVPQSVPELLEIALKYQAPRQKELRAKRRRAYRQFQAEVDAFTEQAEPLEDIVAQIMV